MKFPVTLVIMEAAYIVFTDCRAVTVTLQQPVYISCTSEFTDVVEVHTLATMLCPQAQVISGHCQAIQYAYINNYAIAYCVVHSTAIQ